MNTQITAMPGNEYRESLLHQLFEQAPCNIAVIDRDYKIVDLNSNFREVFGDSVGKRCYEAYKKRSKPCDNCMASQTFADGQVRVNDEVGVDRNGRVAHYVVHIAPLEDDNGEIKYILEMSTDVTETRRLKREYQVLFERVPCYVAILNRDLRIVRANEKFRETFGETTGQHCYEVHKHRSEKCEQCPAEQTFSDGKSHTCDQIGADKDGKTTHYVVTTSPLSRSDPQVAHVVEMAIDVTENKHLEEELVKAVAFREMLIENSIHGIIATDPDNKVIIFNPAAEAMLGYSSGEILKRPLPAEAIPPEYRKKLAEGLEKIEVHEAQLDKKDGSKLPVSLLGFDLRKGKKIYGHATLIRDLREFKQLETEKFEAERLAAVGQTVAGLAHGIKNILTGLEGGMYVFKSGLDRGDKSRVDQGWKMIGRNIEKISGLTKNLLNFSKGQVPDVQVIKPSDVVREVVALFRDAATQSRINLEADLDEVSPAAFDPQDLHTCLTNLLSNALDACLVSEKPTCAIRVSCFEENDAVVFEVADSGCGMDYDIKKKVFTNFFTTKGSGGTGLGLLVTRKITQEHGGKVQLESTPGGGSAFRLIFPRKRLPQVSQNVRETDPIEMMAEGN